MRFPKILIIILNWNGKRDTLECLASLSKADRAPRFSTIVVDNGSTDGSIEEIRAAYPDIPIIETKENLGFAGGNNVALRWASAKSFEWILLLNNDTIVAPDFMAGFMNAAKMQPSGKIFGAKIFRYHDKTRLDHLGGWWNPAAAEFVSYAAGQIDDGSFEEMQKADYVCGCALFMHRSVIDTIGFLEERFFLMWEESDFCERAKQAGFEIWTAPKAKVWHKVSASFTGGKPHMQYFWWRNRLLFIDRNFSKSEKRRLYLRVILPEMGKVIKLACIKTLQCFFYSNPEREQKARRYRAALRGIVHYFLGRFGNCPAAYLKKFILS